MYEPIFMKPVFKDYIWGGTNLKEKLNKHTPYEKTAESWEISANANGKNVISNGEYEGKTLDDLFENKEIRKRIFGAKTENLDRFPLLVKFIDAESNLSVQVHPDNDYAKKEEHDIGKTEMWYIMDCRPNSKIVCGVKQDITKEDIKKYIQGNKIEEILNYITVKKGDAIYIPSGTLHAIMKGILICEIQQNSDLTYRVYDWNRSGKDGKPRELHISKAIDVINVTTNPKANSTNTEGEKNIVNGDFFKTNKVVVDEKYTDETNKESFYIINVIEGSRSLIVSNKEYDIKIGDSFILPASIGRYEINGRIQLLKTWI